MAPTTFINSRGSCNSLRKVPYSHHNALSQGPDQDLSTHTSFPRGTPEAPQENPAKFPGPKPSVNERSGWFSFQYSTAASNYLAIEVCCSSRDDWTDRWHLTGAHFPMERTGLRTVIAVSDAEGGRWIYPAWMPDECDRCRVRQVPVGYAEGVSVAIGCRFGIGCVTRGYAGDLRRLREARLMRGFEIQ